MSVQGLEVKDNTKKNNRNNIFRNILFFLQMISILLIIYYEVCYQFLSKLTTNSSYYLFSSTAQTIATFIALLIAGYTYANSNEEKIEKADETYSEYRKQFKIRYYNSLVELGVLTAIAIVVNLLAIIVTENVVYNYEIYVSAIILSITAIFGGLNFVVEILGPMRDKKSERVIIENITEAFKADRSTDNKHDEKTVILNSRGRFIEDFIDLETMIRMFLMKKKSIPEEKLRTLSQMTEELLRLEIIDLLMKNRLKLISQYRNMVVHGQLDTVDFEVARDLRRLTTELRNVFGTTNRKINSKRS